MSELGHKLRIIRRLRGLSLRQVQALTAALNRNGNLSRGVSASWLGRLEREEHSIPHRTLEALEKVYEVSHEELTDEYISTEQASRTLHAHLPELPAAVLKGLTDPAGEHLLPPESWLMYFPNTTLLPSLTAAKASKTASGRRRPRGDRWYGVLGANDLTLLGVVQPGAVLEIDPTVRTVDRANIYPSVSERPIYFLRSHKGYHCGWCEVDAEQTWLTLVPSTLTRVPHQTWRYRDEIEIVGLVTRVLTRLRFSGSLKPEQINRTQDSDSS